MTKTWYPIINDERCIECGACTDKCTHGVYENDNGHPKVIHPEGCVQGCHGCGELCPAEAISYFGETEKAAPCCCSSGETCDPQSGCC